METERQKQIRALVEELIPILNDKAIEQTDIIHYALLNIIFWSCKQGNVSRKEFAELLQEFVNKY